MRNTLGKNAGREAERRAGEAAHRAHPWTERLARFGYAAKGAVYLLTGALAVGVATGVGAAPPTSVGPSKRSGRSPSGGSFSAWSPSGSSGT